MIVAALPLERDITQIPTISPERAEAFTTGGVIVSALIVLFAFVELARRRSPLLLLCLVGSLGCSLSEPIWDALGGVRFFHGNHTAWTQFPDLAQPIHYPWWTMCTYTAFGGLACYAFYKAFATRSWRIFVGALIGQAVFNIFLEGFLLTSLYDYYGEQPWRVGTDFPLWWVPVNYGEMLAGFLLFLAIQYWGPAKGGLAAIPLVVCSFSAWELWAGWPTYAAINLDIPGGWRVLAAFTSTTIAASSAYLMGKYLFGPVTREALVAVPRPEREAVPA
ncbi:hypothetical protein GCM10009547_08620 [Sporichthya brevicatena]|uniref:Carotenoid biosynthesis protein n=1 Tax=Sporichthya brevicatena TaxID=171442 RepID=A0ABN1GCZ2_9ACTN